MPQKQIKTDADGVVVPYVYSTRQLPPVIEEPKAPRVEKIFGWVMKDGKVEIDVVGERDLFQDIQDAKAETLTEMMERMQGRSPLEKVQNAVNQGLMAVNPNAGSALTDLTGIPDNILDAELLRRKGEAAAASLPEELKGGKKELEEILAQLTEEKIQAYFEKMAPKNEPVKEDAQ